MVYIWCNGVYMVFNYGVYMVHIWIMIYHDTAKWVKTKRSPFVHIKIAGIYGCELPTHIDNLIGFDTHPYHHISIDRLKL